MKEFYTGPRDPRPKRRKSPDNPYTIFSVGIDTPHARFFVEFVDGNGEFQQVEVVEEVFDLFDEFELNDLAQMNRTERHHEFLEKTETTLNRQVTLLRDSLDDQVQKEFELKRLRKALYKLPEHLRRRVNMYFFQDMKLEEIAASEGCSWQAVQQSLNRALPCLREKILKTDL